MITKENVKKIMDLAKENVTKKRFKFNKNAAIRYLYWFVGMVISFVPLFALPFAKTLISAPQSGFFQEIFKSSEIFFVGVSLAIAALNDYIHKTQPKKFSSLWTWSNIIIILFGAMFYGITVILIQNSDVWKININYEFLSTCNFLYLLVIIVVGSYKYIKDILGVK